MGIVPLGPGIVPVREGHGACFCSQGTNYFELLVRSRYKLYRWLKSCQDSKMLVNGHMRSIAVQVVREPEKSHDILELNCVQMRESGYINHLRNCHVSRRKGKNRDKFIDTTDRVMLRRVT